MYVVLSHLPCDCQLFQTKKTCDIVVNVAIENKLKESWKYKKKNYACFVKTRSIAIQLLVEKKVLLLCTRNCACFRSTKIIVITQINRIAGIQLGDHYRNLYCILDVYLPSKNNEKVKTANSDPSRNS